MAEQHNPRGFTHLDAVVVGVVCLLMTLLVPVLLAKPRERSIRAVCAANLSQIGKTMFVYAADYEGVLPRAGGPTTLWGGITNWAAVDRYLAYALAADGSGGRATISSCFYLLVKHYQVPSRLFLCRGDEGTTEFKLGALSTIPPNFELTDAWDFGPAVDAFKHCSFSYHMPFGLYRLTTSRDPNLAVAADRNPYLKSPGADAALRSAFMPDLDVYKGTPEQARAGNAATHKLDGQNVLFLDGRVTFEKRAYCGVQMDNIYLAATTLSDKGSVVGLVPGSRSSPTNTKDSVLVHDPDTWTYGPGSPNP